MLNLYLTLLKAVKMPRKSYPAKLPKIDLTPLPYHKLDLIKLEDSTSDEDSYLCIPMMNDPLFNDELSNCLSTSMSENQFKCDICPKSFKLLRDLKCHEKVHFGKNFSCSICEKGFSTYAACRKHKREHLKKKPNKSHIENLSDKKNLYHCSICENSYSTCSELRKHESIHSGLDTVSYSYLLKIIETNDSTVQSNWCHLCNIDLTSDEQFRLHILQEHKSVSDFDKTIMQNYESLNKNKSIQNASPELTCEKNMRSFSKMSQSTSQVQRDGKNGTIESSEPNAGIKILNYVGLEASQQTVRNPFIVGLGQPQQPGVTFNIFQPLQYQLPTYNQMNVTTSPNIQLVAIPKECSSPNDFDSVPDFNFDSEDYICWLKAFIIKCQSHKYPLPLDLSRIISQVSSDVLYALITPEGSLKRKANHFYLLQFYQTIQEIKLGQARYYLAPRSVSNVNA